jgi:hypothetical protein
MARAKGSMRGAVVSMPQNRRRRLLRPGTKHRPETRPGEETADGGHAAEGGDGLILGFAVASLGDASMPGLWMETPLVSTEGPGRVVGPDGRTVAVTLRPSGGGPGTGSRLSLQAMQALGVDLAACRP